MQSPRASAVALVVGVLVRVAGAAVEAAGGRVEAGVGERVAAGVLVAVSVGRTQTGPPVQASPTASKQPTIEANRRLLNGRVT